MGYLYRPRLKDTTPPPVQKEHLCKHVAHGRTDQCPACRARFYVVW